MQATGFLGYFRGLPWVAVTEVKLIVTIHTPETISYTMYPYNGNLELNSLTTVQFLHTGHLVAVCLILDTVRLRGLFKAERFGVDIGAAKSFQSTIETTAPSSEP